jgi:hypothetical protein
MARSPNRARVPVIIQRENPAHETDLAAMRNFTQKLLGTDIHRRERRPLCAVERGKLSSPREISWRRAASNG